MSEQDRPSNDSRRHGGSARPVATGTPGTESAVSTGQSIELQAAPERQPERPIAVYIPAAIHRLLKIRAVTQSIGMGEMCAEKLKELLTPAQRAEIAEGSAPQLSTLTSQP
jgi:hypothetical protein